MHNGKCKQHIFLFAVCCKVCVAIFYAIYVTFNVMLNTPLKYLVFTLSISPQASFYSEFSIGNDWVYLPG